MADDLHHMLPNLIAGVAQFIRQLDQESEALRQQNAGLRHQLDQRLVTTRA